MEDSGHLIFFTIKSLILRSFSLIYLSTVVAAVGGQFFHLFVALLYLIYYDVT